jgi:hypothetical protein
MPFFSIIPNFQVFDVHLICCPVHVAAQFPANVLAAFHRYFSHRLLVVLEHLRTLVFGIGKLSWI